MNVLSVSRGTIRVIAAIKTISQKLHALAVSQHVENLRRTKTKHTEQAIADATAYDKFVKDQALRRAELDAQEEEARYQLNVKQRQRAATQVALSLEAQSYGHTL